MKLLPARVFAVALCCAFLAAQETPPISNPEARGRAVIAGMVTKDPGGEPLKKVLIELITDNQTEGGNYTAMTGADGAFRIEGILPGRYLYAERTGYLEGDKRHLRIGGRVLTLTASQELKDLLIRLQPAAVIEGRVTDEDGDAVANAQVTVLQQVFAPGRSHWEQASAEHTNDIGEYRIAGLATGTYYISVSPPPDFKSLIANAGNASGNESRNPASDAAAKPALSSYVTIYYPGTKDRSQAMPVQLRAGDNFPANFSLTPTSSVVVRGSVAAVPAGSQAVILLQSKDFSVIVSGADVNKDGSFEIRDVSPGAYTLTASTGSTGTPMTARQDLQVGSENIEGLRLTPQSGASVRGRLRLESKGGARIDLTQCFLSLRSSDGDDDVISALSLGEGFVGLAHVAADGSFEWKNVPAGRYYVQFAGEASSSADWFSEIRLRLRPRRGRYWLRRECRQRLA